MHDDMQYDPIQSQGQGHEPFKLENPSIFKSYLIRRLQWELASDQWLLKGKMSKFGRAGGLFLCHVTLKLAETSVVKSQPSVPHWANLLKC